MPDPHSFRDYIEILDDDRFPDDDPAAIAADTSNDHLREHLLLFLSRYAKEHPGQGPTTATVARQLGMSAEREGIALLLHELAADGRIDKREGGWFLRLGG